MRPSNTFCLGYMLQARYIQKIWRENFGAGREKNIVANARICLLDGFLQFHVFMFLCTFTRAYGYMHTYIQTSIYTHVFASLTVFDCSMFSCSCIYTLAYGYIHTYVQTSYIQTYFPPCAASYTCLHVSVSIHWHMVAYIHTHIHTYIHTYTGGNRRCWLVKAWGGSHSKNWGVYKFQIYILLEISCF